MKVHSSLHSTVVIYKHKIKVLSSLHFTTGIFRHKLKVLSGLHFRLGIYWQSSLNFTVEIYIYMYIKKVLPSLSMGRRLRVYVLSISHEESPKRLYLACCPLSESTSTKYMFSIVCISNLESIGTLCCCVVVLLFYVQYFVHILSPVTDNCHS